LDANGWTWTLLEVGVLPIEATYLAPRLLTIAEALDLARTPNPAPD
jgi:hypothetical protein